MKKSKEKSLKERWIELPRLYKIQLYAYLTAGICSAVCYPETTKLVYSSVETDILASRLVLTSFIGLGLSMAWLSIQERLFSWYIHFSVLECLAYYSLIAYVIWAQDYNSFLIFSAIIGGTLGRIVNGGNSKVHQKITDVEQYRTDYGFFLEIMASLGVLLGSALAVTIPINRVIAFLAMGIGLTGFQITDIYVYLKIKKKEET